MFSRFLACLAFVAFCSGAFATGEPGSDATAPKTIIEISPMSITVDAGRDVQETYTITANTRAILDGLKVQPEDLRAGMIATIYLDHDGKTVLFLTAHAAPRTVAKPPPPPQ
jgi:hypothetical protein